MDLLRDYEVKVFNLDTVVGAPEPLKPLQRLSKVVRAAKVAATVYQHFHMLMLCDNKIYAAPVKVVERTDKGITFCIGETPLRDSQIKKLWIVDDKGRLLKSAEPASPMAIQVGVPVNLSLGMTYSC